MGASSAEEPSRLVRRDLIDEDLVEAVIQLPKDMFYGATIPACWLVINRDKAPCAARAGPLHRRLGVIRANRN